MPGRESGGAVSQRLPRLLVCTGCQVAAALRFAAGVPEAEGGCSPALGTPAAPHAPRPGAGARRGQAARPEGPDSPDSPAPAAWPPPPAATRARGAAVTRAHLRAARTRAEPAWEPTPAAAQESRNPASASSRRRIDRFLFLTHGFRKHILKFSSRI